MNRQIVFACVLSAVLGLTSQTGRADEDDETPIEFHGPAGHPGYPNPFSIGYILRGNTLSPNRRYGVIFPKILLKGKPDFVVDLKNSAILSAVEVDKLVTPYFEHQNRGGLTVSWSSDSTAALVEIDQRWGPGALVVIEMKDGTVYQETDLSKQVEKLFSPAKAKRTRSRAEGIDTYGVTAVKWKTSDSGLRLEIKCEGQTNPKGFSEYSTWEGTFAGVWDLTQRRFIEHEVKQTAFTPAGKDGQ
jgi:hypothetical protein